MLTHEDVLNQKFPTSGLFSSGYIQIEVDAFLDEVAMTLYALQQENEALKAERDALLRERYERTTPADHTPPHGAVPPSDYGNPGSYYTSGGHTE
ncbi:MAG: DivIVA domain-containing protein [Actinomycetaceae bacterium]|nr:DivIVA domain-containing protein [Actinomycetaceae bacterium]